MVSTTRGAARQTPAARRSTEQPPQKKRRASPAAPAAGTAEDPIKADSSSEYDDESYGEFLEPEPAPRKRGRSSTDDVPSKKRKTKKSEAYDSNGRVYAWDELDLDITDEVRGVLNAMDPETAALCRDAAAHATTNTTPIAGAEPRADHTTYARAVGETGQPDGVSRLRADGKTHAGAEPQTHASAVARADAGPDAGPLFATDAGAVVCAYAATLAGALAGAILAPDT